MTELEEKAARERKYDLRTPIIRQIYDITMAIEDCGASEKQTHAVTLSTGLYEPVRLLLAENQALRERLEAMQADAERMREALTGVMGCINDGTLVRNVAHDHEYGWATRQLPLVLALKAAQTILDAARSKP